MRWSVPLSVFALPAASMRIEQALGEDLGEDLEEDMAASVLAQEMELWGLNHQTLTARTIASCDTSRSSCADGELKARRPVPTLLADDFVARLRLGTADDYRVAGAFNDWAAYKDLELLSIACENKGKSKGKAGAFVWARGRSSNECEPAECVKNMDKHCKGSNAQLHLILPDYLRKGWSAASPGWVMLLHNLPGDQYLLHGTDLLTSKEQCRAKTATVFGHEYGDSTGSNPHVGVFVEWDDGCDFGTIFELAFLNGLGGYGGKCNWHDDKFAAKTWIMETMEQHVHGMLQPWNSKKSELRVFDVPFKTQAELQAHFDKFSDGGGHGERKPRFRAVNFPAKDIFQALLNYIGTDDSYDVRSRQCQSFGADLFEYLTSERTTTYSKLPRVFFKPHQDWFMYDPVDE